MTDDVRARFLAGIAAQLPPHLVQEVHLFGAIRQGGAESGVAVIAVSRDVALAVSPDDDLEVSQDDENDVTPDDAPEIRHDEDNDPTPDDERTVRDSGTSPRFTVYSARYRLALKGLDRGKWEMSVTEEADAPLVTVDAVVRGVSRRSGDVDETVRLSGDEFRAATLVGIRA